MMRTIKTIWINSAILLVLTIVLWNLYYHRSHVVNNGINNLELVCFETNDGWGYKIMHNKNQIIYQPFIPAIKQRKAFPTKQAAEATGLMVLQKLNAHELPVIGIEELKKAGIVNNN